jgi:hypothetical protein
MTCQVARLADVRCLVYRGTILAIDFASDMDSDDEMLIQLQEDAQALDDDIRKHLMIIVSL